MFGCETYGIKPDILVVAKALSSAYLPISAVMISEEVYQAVADNSAKIGTFGHGFTYTGHPVSAAVALETLKIYEERDLVGHVQGVAPRFQARLRKLGKHPLVGEAAGVGLIGAVELVADKAEKTPFDPLGSIGPVCAKAVRGGRADRAGPDGPHRLLPAADHHAPTRSTRCSTASSGRWRRPGTT